MGNYPVGRLIAEFRIRRSLSQEELSDGICAASTLSKIENGVQMPNRKVYTALLQRLGLSHRSCLLYVSDLDMRRSALEGDIDRAILSGRYAEARDALAEYAGCGISASEIRASKISASKIGASKITCMAALREWLYAKNRGVDAGDGKFMPEEAWLMSLAAQKDTDLSECRMNALELQYALCRLGILAEKDGRASVALALFSCALGLTMQDFSPEYLGRARFLTGEEIRTLCRVAVLQYANGERVYAKRVLYALWNYMETCWMDEEEKAENYPEILYYLSLWMGNDGRVDRQMECCSLGIRLCLQAGRLTMLPQLLEVKARALRECGMVEQAKPVLEQACLLFQLLGESAMAEELKEEAGALF